MRIRDWSSDVCSSDLRPPGSRTGPTKHRTSPYRNRSGYTPGVSTEDKPSGSPHGLPLSPCFPIRAAASQVCHVAPHPCHATSVAQHICHAARPRGPDRTLGPPTPDPLSFPNHHQPLHVLQPPPPPPVFSYSR